MPEPSHIALDSLPALAALEPITLEEMDGVKLMNRVDTKYVTTEQTLANVLEDAAAEGYRVLVAEGLRISPYDTLYYDTAALRMFQDHQRKKACRQKVRTRIYVSSGDTFLEIKRKKNNGRTKKKRIPLPRPFFQTFPLNEEAAAFCTEKSDFLPSTLSPSVETLFRRITLVNREMTERLTIDTSLLFRNFRTGAEASLKDAVIIELKQDGHAASRMKGILLNRRVKPLRVSKCCIGITLTDPSVKANRFKIKVRAIEKIIHSTL